MRRVDLTDIARTHFINAQKAVIAYFLNADKGYR